jgi:hypothetical protein
VVHTLVLKQVTCSIAVPLYRDADSTVPPAADLVSQKSVVGESVTAAQSAAANRMAVVEAMPMAVPAVVIVAPSLTHLEMQLKVAAIATGPTSEDAILNGATHSPQPHASAMKACDSPEVGVHPQLEHVSRS